MNLHRIHKIGRQTAADAIALVLLATTARRRLVHSIRCQRCQFWTEPRRYDPTYNVCRTCLPAAKAEHRAALRAYERAHGLA